MTSEQRKEHLVMLLEPIDQSLSLEKEPVLLHCCTAHSRQIVESARSVESSVDKLRCQNKQIGLRRIIMAQRSWEGFHFYSMYREHIVVF